MVIAKLVPGGFLKMGTDYAVPVQRNREMLAYYRRRLEAELPGRYVIYGHIGDAHVHVNMLPDEASGVGGVEPAADGVRDSRRWLWAGTVSAEHGLGKRKAGLLALQYAPEHIQAMRDVKSRLDPHWLLGRGTLFQA